MLKFVFILFLAADLAFSAKRIEVKRRLKDGLHLVRRDEGRWRNIGERELSEEMLGLDKEEGLEKQEQTFTEHGTMKTKYSETYQGIPIIGEDVVIETLPSGEPTGEGYGKLLEHIEEDIPSVEPALSKSEAFQAAIHAEGVHASDVTYDVNDAKLVVYVTEFHADNYDDIDAKLAYRLYFLYMLGSLPVVPEYILDANTGKVYLRTNGVEGHSKFIHKKSKKFVNGGYWHPLVAVGGNEKYGPYEYGGKYQKLNVSKLGEECYMQNDIVTVLNANNEVEISSDIQPFHFDCSQGADDEVNGGFSPANDVFHHTNMVYKVYEDWYDMPVLRCNLTAIIHYDVGLDNAFFISEMCLMVFGDGAYQFYPLTSLDITAHELSHGFTAEHSGLEYIAQSGGINEAFSDMAGKAAEEYFGNPTWTVGETVSKGAPLRYMYDPELDKHSIGHADDYCPGIDVHHSSGVFNKAFYLLVEEYGMELRDVFHIFLRANQMYWHANSDFADAACGAIEAANDLELDSTLVEAAFLDVGVVPCVEQQNYASFSVSVGVKCCQPGVIYSFTWNIETEMDRLIIETRSLQYGSLNLFIEAPDEMTYSSNTESTTQRHVIDSPPEGAYNALIEGEGEFTYNFYVIENPVRVETGLHSEYDPILDCGVYTASFEITETSGAVLAIRVMHSPVNIPVFVLRHLEPPNIYTNEYDVVLQDIGNNTMEAFMCNPQPGSYHLFGMEMNPDAVDTTTINIEYMYLWAPERQIIVPII